MKILIVQTASIGDVILSTPLIEKLHAFYPDATIDFLLKKGNEPLFKGHPFIHNLLVWDKKNKKYLHYIDLINYIRAQRYDLLINVQRFASSGLLTLLSKAKKTSGFHKNPFSLFFSNRVKHCIHKDLKGLHEKDRNLKLIENFTDGTSAKVKLYPSQRDYAKVSPYKTHKYICIAPTSLWFTKQYPQEKWMEFLNAVNKEIYVYFLGSKDDIQICRQIILQSNHNNCLNLSGKLSLLESAALMQDALMNFVNDSAPMHLASSVEAPVTAIFCSTIPAFGFGPLSKISHIVETKQRLLCRPCGLHGLRTCPEKHFKCALGIEKEQLLNYI